MKTSRRPFSIPLPAHVSLATLFTLTALAPGARAATKYFDATAGANNGVGGSGTLAAQTTALFSNAATGDATLSTAAATDDGVFQGTAGTVTLSVTPYTLNSATFNTTGYVLTTSTTTAQVFSAPISLAAGINLNLIEATQTANRTLGLGSVTGGTGSTLTIQGAETGTASARINLAVASSTVSVPVTISGTGTSLAGFVATATGENITNTITNNSSFTTLLGATSGFDLTLSSAAVVSGTAGVQFSAGGSGGAGTVTLNSANTYAGQTLFNGAASGAVKLGVDNALPTTTAVIMGFSSGNGQKLDLNGHNQTIASLASNTGGTGSITSSAAGPGTDTLTINGAATTGFALVVADGSTRKVALTLASTNTGTLTLTGANAYTGATTISGGTLAAAATGTNKALGGTGRVAVNPGGTLLLSTANQVNTAAGVTLGGGTVSLANAASQGAGATVSGGTASGTSSVGLGALTLSANSTLNYLGNAATVVFTSFDPTNAGAGTFTLNVTGSNFGAATASADGTNNRLIFNQDIQAAGLLGDITFNGTGGAAEMSLGNGFYEVVAPVPEPTTILGGVLLLGAAAWSQRRRLFGLACLGA